MQVVHPVWCGIDGQPAPWAAWLRRVQDDRTIHTAWRDFGTTYEPLVACRTWRNAPGCPIAVLESPGVYWQPMSHVLGAPLEVVVAKAHAVRQRPGTQTDNAEAAWLAARLAHGLSAPSGIPPPAVQALRDLTRTRGALVQTRTQGHNRIRQGLADPKSKVAQAMSDRFGPRGRRRLKAWCAGARHPQKRAALALGT